MAVSSSASLSPSTLRLSQGGTLQFLSSFNASSLVGLALTFGDGTIDTNGHDATIAAGAYGGGRLVKAGSGTLTLSGNNHPQRRHASQRRHVGGVERRLTWVVERAGSRSTAAR